MVGLNNNMEKDNQTSYDIKEQWKYTNINKIQSIKNQKNSSNCNNL